MAKRKASTTRGTRSAPARQRPVPAARPAAAGKTASGQRKPGKAAAQQSASAKSASAKSRAAKSSAAKSSAAKSSAAKSKYRSAGAAHGSAHGAVVARLQSRLAAAQARIAALEAQAETDALTGTLNRRGFERELRRSMAYCKRYRATAALIYLDVDRLKPVNDAFGHAAGDAVLRAIARLLNAHVRLSDVIGRLGGDEFCILLWHASEAVAQAKAEALERDLAQAELRYRGRVVTIGVSAGVTDVRVGETAEAALARADHAMYARKRARRAKSDHRAATTTPERR